MNTTTILRTHRPFAGPFNAGRFAIGTIAATILNIGVHVVGEGIGASMSIDSPAYQNISLPMTGIATFVPFAVAGGVTWFLGRRYPRVIRPFRWIGLAVALVSIISPLAVANDTETGIALAAMHVVGGLAWYLGLQGESDREAN
jgi:hypothetical protein